MKIHFRSNIQKLYRSIILASLIIKGLFFLPLVSLAQPPAWCVELGRLAADGESQDVFVKDNYAYVAAGDILSIIDVSTPSSPKEVGYYDTPGYALGVYALGGYIYVGDFGSGLWILNFTKEFHSH